MTSLTAAGPATGIADNVALRFVARRLIRFAVSLWVLLTAAFLMIHLIPGDPVRAALGISAPPELVAARRVRAAVRHEPYAKPMTAIAILEPAMNE